MNCSGCGFAIQSGFAFCPKCGAKQPAACASCGNLLDPDFAFCPQCGAAVTGTARHGNGAVRPTAAAALPPLTPIESRQTTQADRRPVTVLFADLSGFTTLSERLDPEDVQALQNQLFEEMTA